MKRVLIACEESQTVCKAFRAKGFEAFSCDIQDCSGGYSEWHIKDDVLKHINAGWDLIIAHPPCTYLSKAGARWLYAGGRLDQKRLELGLAAKDFFNAMLNSNAKHIAVENPTPMKVYDMPNHSQVIQPWQFGHAYSKRTLLWLKNLPMLVPTNIVKEHKPYLPSNTGGKKRGHSYSIGVSKNAKQSSKTFEGIAKAMAEQWGAVL
jgi:site-specific DNA-cytosine methylase